MSKPRERWWTYVRNVIRAYPELLRQEEQLHELPVTRQPKTIIDPKTGERSDFYGVGGGGGDGRQIENAVLRSLNGQAQRELDAVRKALEAIKLMPSGRSRLRFIRTYHFEQQKMEAAAYKTHIAEATARRWNRDIMYFVAKNLGLYEKNDTHRP